MNMIDLFSGIGGFRLAAQWVFGESLDCKCMVEIDRKNQMRLEKNWPGVKIHDDIKTFDGRGWGPIDLLTGGFPCQPFSVAGKQGGSEDDRYLWPEMLRIIKEAKPRWVVGENVTGIINMALGDVLASLEGAGYDFPRTIDGKPIVFNIPACGVDARHKRERIWIVANARGRGLSKQNICGEQPGGTEVIGTSKGVAHTKRERAGVETQDPYRQERKTAEPSQSTMVRQGNGEVDAERVRTCREDVADTESKQDRRSGQSWEDAGRIQGWVPEPSVGRVAHGVPNRVDRLKGLGNAIVPQVAERIFWGVRCVDDMMARQNITCCVSAAEGGRVGYLGPSDC